MKLDAPEARSTASPRISAGSPIRPSGTAARLQTGNGLGELDSGLAKRVGVLVGNHNRRAALGQHASDGEAETGCAASHEHDQPAHVEQTGQRLAHERTVKGRHRVVHKPAARRKRVLHHWLPAGHDADRIMSRRGPSTAGCMARGGCMAGREKLLDPTGFGEQSADTTLAPRPPSLRGKRVALVENTKPNAAVLLASVGRQLEREHGVRSAVMFSKSYFGTPVEESLIQRILRNSDFVVAGIGD
jgi:hypothetical protein